MPEPQDGREEVRARVTMPLLDLVTKQSLDEDYLQAARRRTDLGQGSPRRTTPGRTRVVTAVVVALFGVLVATAAVQTERTADVRDASRTSLIAQIEARRDQVADEQRQIAELRERTVAGEEYLTGLTQDEQVATDQLRGLQSLTGFGAVTGGGVRVTLDSSPTAGEEQQLRDTDLALLTNALWSAGAEAIAINGQRLTAGTAIRTSGQAIEVNDVGVAPPFTVSVIGDEDTLQARFYDTSSGLAFDDLARRFGFRFDMENVDALSLPAAPERLQRLRSVGADAGPPRSDPETR